MRKPAFPIGLRAFVATARSRVLASRIPGRPSLRTGLANPLGRTLARKLLLPSLFAMAAPILAFFFALTSSPPDSILAVTTAALVALAASAGYFYFLVLRMARTLGRMELAMRAIRARAVPAPLPVGDTGELCDIVEAFNGMAGSLSREYATHGALKKIDRFILAGADPDVVMRMAARGLRAIAPSEAIIVGLLAGKGRSAMNIYALRFPGEAPTVKRGMLPIDDAVREGLPSLPSCEWQGRLPLPDKLCQWVEAEASLRHFTVLPVHGTSEKRGVVVLGHAAPTRLEAEELTRACDIADRLEIAFSSAENSRRLNRLANSDGLTGLPNRNALVLLMQNELWRARRRGTRVGVIFLDLDRFKQVNDTMGHEAGDALLKEAAERIRGGVREADTVARHGGDEFIVVLGDISVVADASEIARELIRSLSLAFDIDGKQVYVGASAGISVFPEDGSEPEDLLKKADTAMYRAKEQGRSRVAFFESSMFDELQRRAALDRDLRKAVERREFVLHYQPQFDLATGTIFGVEALIRWVHPERGMLAPNLFIPIAEESGLIDAIGTWVLKEACSQFERWRADGVPIARMAVNVSIRQMRRTNFLAMVQKVLARSDMPPEKLEIEVTESMFLQGDAAAQAVIDALVKMGVRLAIDDFGTGYSSFSYLKSVPATVLKLDRSFIRDSAQDRDAGAIVSAMINMARILGKEVVAEGVETEEQLAFLRSLGCERVQGFHFSRPLSAGDMARFAFERAASEACDPDTHPVLA